MAAGDAVGYIERINASTTSNYQPAAGVEICITSLGFSVPASSKVRVVDGGVEAPQYVNLPSTVNAQGFLNTKIIISNSFYLQLRNDGAGAADFGFTGIQLK